MSTTNREDAHWASLMRVIRRIPKAWKHDGVVSGGLSQPCRGFSGRARRGGTFRTDWLLACVSHRFRRWWWDFPFERLRPALPADGLMLADSTTCKARHAPSSAVHMVNPRLTEFSCTA